MSDFLSKAKDMASDLKDKVEDVIEKVEDHIPGHQDLKAKWSSAELHGCNLVVAEGAACRGGRVAVGRRGVQT